MIIWENCSFKGFLEQDKVNMSWKQQIIMNEMRKDEKLNISVMHYSIHLPPIKAESLLIALTMGSPVPTVPTWSTAEKRDGQTDRSSAGLKRLSLAGRGSLNTPQPLDEGAMRHKRRGNPEMIMQMKVFLTQINTVISHYHHYCSNLISTADGFSEPATKVCWNSTLRRNLARKTQQTREKFGKQSLKKIQMPINVFIKATR